MTRFINQFDIKYLMVKRIVGRTKINVIDSIPYSQLIFLVASGKSYALNIAEARGKTDSSPTAKQLKQLEARGFLKSQKEKLLNKTVYSVNWKKIIEEFIKYVNENINYVCSENKRIGMNLDKVIKGFNERIQQIKSKDFQRDIKKNKYLISFFKKYFSETGRLKENWTITATFDFLSFFGDMNFLYKWIPSHDFYNIEKALDFINSKEGNSFPEWLIEEKEPKTKEEEFERYKKISKHTETNFSKIEEKTNQQLKEIIKENKEIFDLYILSRILAVVKIKPSLQIGLNNAIKETGKEIFIQAIPKEKIIKYFNFSSFFESQEQVKEDLKEIIGENGFKVTKPIENKHKKSGNTNQNKALSSENKQGESSK
jgi:hypothetical protein